MRELSASEGHSAWIQWLVAIYVSCDWVALLIALQVLDIVAGITAAVINDKLRLSSKIGQRGLMKKAIVLIVVATMVVLEQVIYNTIPEALRGTVPVIPLAKIIAGFFSLNEVLSILENAKTAGAPLPNFLKKNLVDTIANISNMGGPVGEPTHLHVDVKNVTIDAVTNQTPPSSGDSTKSQ